ncbi:MAG: Gfo/Idh/MocA family oxidoreductase [Desulfobacterales bacterium]|nr:MAG: Gfo/Idh/MocA family oxidoreductase [Desulfobacterales bacterium]
MKKIRVGVVGVGYLGRFHAEKYAQMNDVELVALADTDRSRAATVAAQVGASAYSHHRELIGRVDAVSVVVPTSAHFQVSRDFLEHGVDVMIEKPITETLPEADELIQMSARSGLIIQVGHLERFNPAVVALRDIVKHPMFIESHRLSLFKPRATDVSVVLDLMIHDIDIILNFVQADLDHLHAAGIPVISGEVDIANARLEFKNGCVANVTASRISAKNERKIRLFQSDAYISVDFAQQMITITRRNGEDHGGPFAGLEITQRRFAPGDALEEELKSFVQAVATRQAPEVSGKVGRDALAIALSIMDQINTTNRRFLNK